MEPFAIMILAAKTLSDVKPHARDRYLRQIHTWRQHERYNDI